MHMAHDLAFEMFEPDIGRPVTLMHCNYAPQMARARVNRDNAAVLPKMAEVVSMGGDGRYPSSRYRNTLTAP